MRILVLGAGAVGGYFGGCLLQAGVDVTFLVREKRKRFLQNNGLVIKTPDKTFVLTAPPTVLREEIDKPYDVILLSCKAYDLNEAIESIKPAVGPDTTIIPLLNGMKHLSVLDAAFGKEKILGGLCAIIATLGSDGEIIRFTALHNMVFGERNGKLSERVNRIGELFKSAAFNLSVSENILLAMWEKWLFLSTLAGSTCLMRAPIGDIVSFPQGKIFIKSLFNEIYRIAELSGYIPRESYCLQTLQTLTEKDSPLTASMYRDLVQGQRIESEQIIDDLLHRGAEHGKSPEDFPLLSLTSVHLKTYEAQRNRK